MTGNRFIQDAERGFIGLLPYTICARRVTFGDPEQEGWALVDNIGYLVEPYELFELLSAVKPFYDTVPSEEIAAFNDARDEEKLHRPRRSSGHQSTSENRPGYVYLLEAGPYYKIGLSHNVDKRIKTLRTLPPFDLDLICTIETDDMYGLEARLHERFADKRKNGEWFELEKSDVEYIKGLVDG